ncbi:hypothetical protein CJ030_MR3G019056 [Morella rubra]|uniref:Uncharacterized protein n=1 Tax=Morella rubra TaxID=262757 RepID=A0A6A1WBY1_9ROSI|nr:hypothetical protein CJ030_MR3G019056 [Morella rubra]
MSQGTPACPGSCASTSASKSRRGRTRGSVWRRSWVWVQDHFDLDYTVMRTKEAMLLKPHPDTTEELSKELCNLFTNETFMQNKKNRSKLTVNHATGSLSFQHTRACMKNLDSDQINPAELYKKNYTNKDGVLTSKRAREMYERMDSFQRQCDLERNTYTEIEHQLAKARDEIEAKKAAREKDLQEFTKKQVEMEATLRDHCEE